jgi:Domain of unknown function (DUF5010)/DUF5010 C-terminal domain
VPSILKAAADWLAPIPPRWYPFGVAHAAFRPAFALLGLFSVLASACEARDTSVGSFQEPTINGRAVVASEITLQSVTTFGPVPVFSALTGYASDEASAAQANQLPLYAPYDSTDPAWWDDLVAEQSQARVRRVQFPTRGAASLDATDTSGPGNMNPRRLSAWLDALTRAGSTDLFEAGCFVDTPFLQQLSASFHALPAGTPLDVSLKSDWNDIFWLRAIKPWFDTIPSSYWWTLDDDTPGGTGPAVIQFGPLDDALFKNQSGNASQLLTFIAMQFEAAYGTAPVFVLDASWFSADPSIAMLTTVVGNSPEFAPPSTPAAFMPFLNRSFGTAVPGFSDPSFDDPTSPNYHSDSVVIPRKANAAGGLSGTTLESGLIDATDTASITLLQSFTDYAASSGFYRSLAWDFPNQYLNLVRRYGDLRTVTLRLEAEACDRYEDTTPGNSGAAFRRSGDLDVRALASGSGWAVTNTAPGEWLEFDAIDFSAGNYEFIANYATTDSSADAGAPPSKRLQITIDGVKLLPAVVPGTADADTFSAAFLGQATLLHGPHTLVMTFLDGQVDLDWLFVKKTDSLVSLQASSGMFVSAIGGGNESLRDSVTRASIYENFSFDDLNGGALTDGDGVYLQSYDGYYVTADTTSGMLSATARAPGTGTAFSVKNLTAAGDIAVGQSIALLAADGAHYVTVGANQVLDVSGTSVGPAQTFIVGISAQ